MPPHNQRRLLCRLRPLVSLGSPRCDQTPIVCLPLDYDASLQSVIFKGAGSHLFFRQGIMRELAGHNSSLYDQNKNSRKQNCKSV